MDLCGSEISECDKDRLLEEWIKRRETEYKKRVKPYARPEVGGKTLQAYLLAWKHFAQWAKEKGISPFPTSPETLCCYLSYMYEKGYSASSVDQALAAINKIYGIKGFPSLSKVPDVKDLIQKIRKAKQKKQ